MARHLIHPERAAAVEPSSLDDDIAAAAANMRGAAARASTAAYAGASEEVVSTIAAIRELAAIESCHVLLMGRRCEVIAVEDFESVKVRSGEPERTCGWCDSNCC